MTKFNLKKSESILKEDIEKIYHEYQDKFFNGYAEKVSENSYNIIINNFGYKKISQRETFLMFTISRNVDFEYGFIYKFSHEGGHLHITKAEDKNLVKQSKSILLSISGAIIQK